MRALFSSLSHSAHSSLQSLGLGLIVGYRFHSMPTSGPWPRLAKRQAPPRPCIGSRCLSAAPLTARWALQECHLAHMHRMFDPDSGTTVVQTTSSGKLGCDVWQAARRGGQEGVVGGFNGTHCVVCDACHYFDGTQCAPCTRWTRHHLHSSTINLISQANALTLPHSCWEGVLSRAAPPSRVNCGCRLNV